MSFTGVLRPLLSRLQLKTGRLLLMTIIEVRWLTTSSTQLPIVKNIHRFGLEPHRAQEKLGIPSFGVSNPR